MPFKNKAQMRACFAQKNPKWDCRKWAKETNMKSLPKKLRGGCLKCGGKMKKYQEGGCFDAIGNPVPCEDQQLSGSSGMTWNRGMQQVPVMAPQPTDPALTTRIQETGDQAGFPVDPIRQKRNGQWEIMQDSQKIDPYFALRGAKTGLSWLGNVLERKRQNQYLQNQLSILGQRQPVPVEDYQPNPYNLYAKYGGRMKTFKKIARNRKKK